MMENAEKEEARHPEVTMDDDASRFAFVSDNKNLGREERKRKIWSK